MPYTLKKIVFSLLFIILVIFQTLPVIRSGLNYSYGIGFWGPSGHDGVWHLSLINHISNPFSINHPTFFGHKLTNYHPFYDILISLISRFTHIDSSLLLFQISPVILTCLLIILSYKLGKLLTSSSLGGYYLVFLNIAASSFGWIIPLLTKGVFGGESYFWAMQSISTQLNPPYSLSLIFILLFLILLYKGKYPLLLCFLVIITPITKAYGGLVIFIYFTLHTIHQRRYLKIFLISTIMSLSLFFYYNPLSTKLLVFQPFWFINSMLSSPDRLYIPKLASFINTSISSNRFDFRFYIIEFIGLLLFVVGNYSWRLIGFLSLKTKNINLINIALTVLVCTIIPVLFIQNGTAWNTIQFMYYGLFLSNILLAYYLVKRHNLILITIIFITTIFANIDTLIWSTGNPAPAAIPLAEKKALDYLKNQPGNVVLTYPYNPYIKSKFNKTPLPLYAYETTAYVSAYSHKYTYIEDEMNLNISGYDYSFRLQESTKFFNLTSIFEDRGFLINNLIDYIYIANIYDQPFYPDLTNLGITKIYEKDNVLIYKVIR